jgi:acyl carrier protein
MKLAEVESRARALFVEELAIEDSEVVADLGYGDIPEWDSIAHIHLVTAFEEAFEISLDDDEIAQLSPFSSIAPIIAGKLDSNE